MPSVGELKWAMASPTNGTGGGTVSITAGRNQTTLTRSQTFTVKTASGLTKTVSCSQAAGTKQNNGGILTCDFVYGQYIDGTTIGFDVTFDYAVTSYVTVSFNLHLDPASTGLQGKDVSGYCSVSKGMKGGSGRVNTGGQIGFNRGAISNVSVSPSSDDTYNYSIMVV